VFCGVGTKILPTPDRDNYPKFGFIVSILGTLMVWPLHLNTSAALNGNPEQISRSSPGLENHGIRPIELSHALGETGAEWLEI
jgi:hypothetical protein